MKKMFYALKYQHTLVLEILELFYLETNFKYFKLYIKKESLKEYSILVLRQFLFFNRSRGIVRILAAHIIYQLVLS